MSQNVIQITPVRELLECRRPVRDYHLRLDEQSTHIFDVVAERTRPLGPATLRSIRDIAQHQHL